MKPGITFEVPVRLGRGGNDRGSWKKRHFVRRNPERDAILLAAAGVVALEGCARARLGDVLREMARKPVEVRLVRLHTRHSKGLDRDNLVACCKAVRDALTEVMGLASDRESDVLAWTYAQEDAWTWGLRVEVGPLLPPVKLPEWTAEEWRLVARTLGGTWSRESERLAGEALAVAEQLEGRCKP